MMEASVSAHVAQRVRASGRRYWTAAELRRGVESAAAVKAAINRLVGKGDLKRVRRGVYWHAGELSDARARRRRVRSGAALARTLADRDALGASGRQAANMLGLSTQVSPIEVIAVTRRPPRPIAGVRFVDRSARRGRRDQHLSELEVTILEALEGWERYIELSSSEAIERFVQLLADERVRRDALARASRTEPATVRERLRALLERGGWIDEATQIPRAVDNRTRERSLKVFKAR